MSDEQQQEPYDRRRPANHPSVRASRAPVARYIRTRRPAGRKYFLGIAIDKYEHWPQRRNAGRDVQAISELLLAEYGFGKDDVHLLTDGEATFDGVIGVLRKMAGLVSQHDSLVVYYAGHSHFDELTRRGFWIPVNAGRRKTEDYLPNSLIRDFLANIPSLHTLLISDSCFSGSLFARGYQRDEQLTIDELMLIHSSWVICSGHHDETVADGPAEGHSPFAQSILDVLQKSEHGHITLDFLLDQVRNQTRSNYDQLPEGGPLVNISSERGQFVFSRRQRVRKPEDELAWAKVVAMPEESPTQVQEKRFQVTLFFNSHRGSEHLTKVIQLDKQLVERQAFLSLRDTELRLYGFLRMFPYSPYVPEVRKRLEAVLKTQAVGDTIETEKRAEESRKPPVLPAEQKPPANTVQKPFVDFMLPEMVLVEGGSFDMGCTSEQQDCQDDEELVHWVTLDSYFIGKYPVTQAQWRLVMGNNPSSFMRCNRCPVEHVSWEDVQDFIRRLNELTGQNYRLPTEAEWEFAARGGNRSQGYQYAGGGNLADVGWYTSNSGSKTHPVGQKHANELGLYDMSGNVWEWCQDWFGDYPPSAQTNPVGPSIGCYRVLRGGSWLDDPQKCRVASRFCSSPGDRFFILGFRLAKTP